MGIPPSLTLQALALTVLPADALSHAPSRPGHVALLEQCRGGPCLTLSGPLDQAKLQEKLHTASPGIGTPTSTITTLVWTLKWGRATWLQCHTDVVRIMVSTDPSYTLAGEAMGKIFCQNKGINQKRDIPRKWGLQHGTGCRGPPRRALWLCPGTEGSRPEGAGQQTGSSLQKMTGGPGGSFPLYKMGTTERPHSVG